MKNSIRRLGENILKEGERAKFRNERKRFAEFVETIAARFPGAMSDDRTLNEPYRSLAFLVIIGQRPATSLLILEILLRTGEKPLNGKEIGEELAKEIKISSALTTRGGNYKDRVGDLISAFLKIGILESVTSEKSGHPKDEGFRIKKSVIAEVEAFIESVKLKRGVLYHFKPLKLENLFKARFDQRLKYVIKSGSEERQRFSIGKIVKSLLDPKLGVSFENAIRVVEEIEPRLETGMKTVDIQSMLYNTLKRHDKKAAENYRLSYPEIFSITMSDGETKTVNYKLVKTLIAKEVKLKLTRNLLDKFASTVYNVIARNPKNYQHETAVREYIDALIRSECMHIRSDASFVRDHLKSAISALEGCRNSLQSDEVDPARGLLEQFLEQVCLVTLVEFGYLPFKDFRQNVDLISNLLKEGKVKKELEREFQLKEKDIFQFQRIKFLLQMKDAANRKSLEKIVTECEILVDLCGNISKISTPRITPKPIVAEVSEAVFPSHVTTGYDDLDNLLSGGIPEKYAVILTSPSCDERDLLLERFLQAGVKEDQITFHVTIDAGGVETLAEEFPSSFYIFICNPEADAIIQSLPNVFKLRGVENLTEIDIALNNAFRQLDKTPKMTRRACIEIVSDVLLQHHAVSTRRWLTALIPKFKSRGFTTLAAMNPHMHSSQEVQAILDLFQGEVHVYRKKTEKGMKRFLRIERMYNLKYLESELPLRKEKLQK
ncbi:MAG: ATPase domain-containing protein [Candidatus Bathyarchaeota archaeon]